MKILLLSLFSFFLHSFVLAQRIPDMVLESFDNQFPLAEEVEWSCTNSQCEASFYDNSSHYLIKYNKMGQCLETCYSIHPDELPVKAIALLKTNYKGYTVSTTEKMMTDKNVVSYKIIIDNLHSSLELIVDEKGTLLNKMELAMLSHH